MEEHHREVLKKSTKNRQKKKTKYPKNVKGNTLLENAIGDLEEIINKKDDHENMKCQKVSVENVPSVANTATRVMLLEDLSLANQAVSLSSCDAACRSKRASVLTALGRFSEAVIDFENAVDLDNSVAHRRALAAIYLRLGQVELARKYFCYQGEQPDPAKLKKLLTVEKHLSRCATAKGDGDWTNTLEECDAAIAAGAESCPQLFACRAEALLKLYKLEDAESSLACIPKLEPYPKSCSQTKFCGILLESYIFFVRALVEMAFGRFDKAVVAAEKARQIDQMSEEVLSLRQNVILVADAWKIGKEHFNNKKFVEAISAYGDGLKADPFNARLHCNTAICWAHLEEWENSVEACNHALLFRPKYDKALFWRATSNSKLKKWFEAVKDYENLKNQCPESTDFRDSLYHAQVALKKSYAEDIDDGIKQIQDVEQYKAAIAAPGVSVVYFGTSSEQEREQVSQYVDRLYAIFPSLRFLKVNINDIPALAKSEEVEVVPTIRIYKNSKQETGMVWHGPEDYDLLYYSVSKYSV